MHFKTGVALIALGLIASFIALGIPKILSHTCAVLVSKVRIKKAPAAISSLHWAATLAPGITRNQTAKHRESDQLDASDKAIMQLVSDIYQALDSADSAQHDLVSTKLLPSLILLDPRVAGYLAENWDLGPVREELLRQVAGEWTKQNPAQAIEWAANLKDTSERTDALGNACIQISQSNPAQAVATAERFGVGKNDGILDNATQLWASQDPSAALGWAQGQPPGEQRDRLMTRIVFVEAQTAPSEAARFVSEEIPPGPMQDEAIISVLHQWGLRDSAGASAWVSNFAESPLRERAINELAAVATN